MTIFSSPLVLTVLLPFPPFLIPAMPFSLPSLVFDSMSPGFASIFLALGVESDALVLDFAGSARQPPALDAIVHDLRTSAWRESEATPLPGAFEADAA